MGHSALSFVGGIMVEKIKKAACTLLLAVSLVSASVVDAYATGASAAIGAMGTTTPWGALAVLLALCGIVSDPGKSIQEVKNDMERLQRDWSDWVQERYGSAEVNSEKIQAWLERVGKGTIDTASQVWASFKGWAYSLRTATSSGGGDAVASLEFPVLRKIQHLSGSYTDDDFAKAYDYLSRFDTWWGTHKAADNNIWFNAWTGPATCYIDVDAGTIEIDTGGSFYRSCLQVKGKTAYTHPNTEDSYYLRTDGNDTYLLRYFPPASTNNRSLILSPNIDVVVKGSQVGSAVLDGVSVLDTPLSGVIDRDGSLDNVGLVAKNPALGGIATDVTIDWSKVGSIEGVIEGVQTGAGTISGVLDGAGVLVTDKAEDKVITDTGSIPITDVVVDTTEFEDFTLAGLEKFFPFCIPFDLIDFLGVLAATPQAPHFRWPIQYPTADGMKEYVIDIDLSKFDTVAALVRDMECLAFIIGLILITRDKMIKG